MLTHPTSDETTLYVVRHGRTQSNVRQTLAGKIDVPLDTLGLAQAQRIADRMAETATIDALLTSPLSRARTTAATIGGRIGLAPTDVPGLVEMDFGDLENYTIDRIVAEHPEIARRIEDFADHDLAWPGGESRRQFHERVLTTFLAILADHPRQTVAVVAHGGVINSFIAQIEGESPNDWRRQPIANCSLTHLVVGAEGTLIHCVSDIEHLADLVDDDVPEKT